MRTLILHNPGSGNGHLSGERLVELFSDEGHEVSYRDVKADGIDPEAASGADLVVVGGGDGTVGKAVRAMGSCDIPFLIVPLGTANNIARSLGTPFSPEVIARGCGAWGERRIDLGIAGGCFGRRTFLESVGIGAVAELVADGDRRDMSFQEEKRFGRKVPPVAVRQARSGQWNAAVDGVPLPEELLLLEVLNMPLAGPSLPLGAGGAPDDGLLDVAFLRPQHRDAFATWLQGDRTGQPEGLEVVRGRHVSFMWESGPLLIDDHFPDPAGNVSRVDVHLARSQLRLLVPTGEGD